MVASAMKWVKKGIKENIESVNQLSIQLFPHAAGAIETMILYFSLLDSR